MAEPAGQARSDPPACRGCEMRLGTTWGRWGYLGIPARPCTCPAHDPRGPTPFQHVKRKGTGLGWTDCSRFLACRTLKPARLARLHKISRYDTALSHSHTHTRTKKIQPIRSPSTPPSRRQTVIRIACPFGCQQSIDESTNQPVSSHHHSAIVFSPRLDCAKVQLD